MKIDISSLFKSLGIPVRLVAVLVMILALFGLSFDQVLSVAGTMVGLWALLSLTVNVLKVIGVVDMGAAGKWSAALNLLAIAGIAYILKINPSYNFVGLDASLKVAAQLGGLLLTYLINTLGTKALHNVQVKGLGIEAFSQGHTFAGNARFSEGLR